jgi:hypothetical protein
MGAIAIGGGRDRLRELVRQGLISLATVFTQAGTSIITSRILQTGTAPVNIGWGTGTTPAAVTDTSLETEAAPTTGGGRVVGTASSTTAVYVNDNYQVQGTVVATVALAVSEAGLFDQPAAGNMLTRGVFLAVNVNPADSILFTFGLRFIPG